MTAKSLKQLTSIFADALSSLEESDAKTVLSALDSKKSELSKLLGGGTGTRTKRKKDPNAPKKWQTAYIIFCGEHHSKVKASEPTLSGTQITSRLGEMWKAVSEKEKEKYEALSKKDKARYAKEMESYVPPPEDELEEKGKRVRGQKKERTGPKRPLSAYMYFCQDAREAIKNDHPDMAGREVTTELGRRWKELSDEQKKPYEAKHATDKERYASEKASGAETSESKPAAKAPAKESKPAAKAPAKESKPAAKAPTKEFKPAAKAPAKESKPAAKAPAKGGKEEAVKKTPGFECFSEELRDEIETENPDWRPGKVDAELAKRWRELSDDDRETYELEASGDVESENEVELADE